MSSATFVGTTNPASPSGFCSVPPPPPPPPVAGQVPAMRINTVEPSMPRRSQVYNNDSYEPPAAIQNAMMTKDKKPFTYTPGMGGKLDLSQIRSPRMARRVAKNANDEGIEGPPKSPLATEQSRPVSTGNNLFVQPQVAVPVFPTNPSTLQVNRTSNVARAPSNVIRDIESEPPRPMVKMDQSPSSQLNSPDTPSTPTQVTLTKAPTPWMQKNKQQEELPEWAKRSTPNESSSYPSRNDSNNTQTIYIQQPSQQKIQTKPTSNERIIPLRVEDRPSVFAAKNEQGHHQFKQSSPHHQQRWGQPVQQPQTPSTPRVISTPAKSPQPSSPGTYIVPIVVENSNNTIYIQRNDFPGNSIQNQVNKNVQKTPIMNQQESGPVQSKSFRVLQKITDTDRDDIDTEQLRKLQLTEDDKMLMNKFKEQVDGDTYLHQEEDPRYRGAAIPSRAFRYLQNMTDSNEVLTNTNEEAQMNLPPSEQQVPEPKKYTGSAIPSRSFRILQAMTSPEDVGLNSTNKESRDELQVPEMKDKQNITDCESYTEEEEPYTTMETNNYKNNDSFEQSNNNVDTTVNISLPIKFKFSVSTDDEEITTVNVVNKKIQSDQSETHQNTSEVNHNDKNDVCVNLKINYDSDTCANFTLKKKSSMRPKSWCPDESSNDFWISETIVRKQSSPFTNSNLQECIIKEEVQESNNQKVNKEQNNEMKIIPEFEVTLNEVQNVDEDKNIDDNKRNPSLLTVQSSRDETDDEDSGVTSDMSRLISEVDTDSECTPSRKLNTYTRTQTHSRLFKLLTDDLTTLCNTEATTLESKPERRSQLNLPLRKSSRFSYDCSKDSNSTLNNSSIQKPTWKKFFNSFNGQTESENNDKYFQTWKEAKQSQYSVQPSKHNSVSTDKKLAYWSYKTNILCPRVKSGKNVPKILEGRIRKPVVHPISSCVRYDRC